MIRRWFIHSQHGWFGIGLARIQFGGVTYIIGGGSWPLLFPPLLDLTRFIPLHGSDAQPLRNFVGGCFLDGILDGEFVIDDKKGVTPAYQI
jgi:hypothetical protein